MTAIKFCGITDRAAMDAVVRTGAEWVGLNFVPASPRFITPAQAAALLRPGPAPVALFVDPDDDTIAQTIAALPLAALQIHAPLARAAAVRARFGLPVWWAVGVATPADLPTSAPGIDRLLLDRKAPPGAPLPGGNAQPFDWSTLAAWHPPVPWALAGGLTPANVADAIRRTHAPTVDVSSGVEHARGQKSPALIEAFAAAVRAAGP